MTNTYTVERVEIQRAGKSPSCKRWSRRVRESVWMVRFTSPASTFLLNGWYSTKADAQLRAQECTEYAKCQ
jgi:hypothetical protein